MFFGVRDPLKVSSRVHETLLFVVPSFSWYSRLAMFLERKKGFKVVFSMDEKAMKNGCVSRGTPGNSG